MARNLTNPSDPNETARGKSESGEELEFWKVEGWHVASRRQFSYHFRRTLKRSLFRNNETVKLSDGWGYDEGQGTDQEKATDNVLLVRTLSGNPVPGMKNAGPGGKAKLTDNHGGNAGGNHGGNAAGRGATMG